MDIDTPEIRPVDLSMAHYCWMVSGNGQALRRSPRNYRQCLFWSGIPGAYESLDESETDGERCETDEESNESETDDEYGN